MNISKIIFVFTLSFIFHFSSFSQSTEWSAYEPSSANPFGKINPEAPSQVNDFGPMIGICDCKSLRRNPDGNWADTTNMVWSFKYILNGTAIQDETWSENTHATSIRQFHPDSLKWVVSYSSFPGVTLSPKAWIGSKTGDKIILNLDQKAPNGMDGVSRLTFENISKDGFDWRGEWVNEQNNIVYPFWLIWCEKRK